VEAAKDWIVKFKLAGAESPKGVAVLRLKASKNTRVTSPPAPWAAARPSARVNGSVMLAPLLPGVAVGDTYHVPAAVPSV